MMTSEFSAYYNNPAMLDILDSMPKAILDAFSMSGSNLTTVSGFISMASFYFYLLLSIHAVLLGSTLISKEERDKTVEFLMTLPVARKKVIFSKLVAGILISVIMNLVVLISIYATTIPYDRGDGFNKFMILLMIAIFIIQMIFMSIGMLFGAIMKRYKKSGNYSLSLLLGLYFLYVIIGLSQSLEKLKYLTPFKYFESSLILKTGQLEGVYVLISISIIVVAIFFTFVVYSKRDLHI